MLGGYLASPLVMSLGWQANGQFVLAPIALAADLLIVFFVKSDKAVHEVRMAERAARDEADGVAPVAGGSAS